MMSSSSSEDVFLLGMLVSEEEEEQGKRLWVHNINKKRGQYGEFHHLFPDLLVEDRIFFQYFRMSREKFYELLKYATDTTWRKLLTAECSQVVPEKHEPLLLRHNVPLLCAHLCNTTRCFDA